MLGTKTEEHSRDNYVVQVEGIRQTSPQILDVSFLFDKTVGGCSTGIVDIHLREKVVGNGDVGLLREADHESLLGNILWYRKKPKIKL